MPNSNSTNANTVTTTATSAISTIINSNNNNNNNNDTVTLRNLTAYDMLDERINMLELFNLADTSEIDKYKLCYNIERQQILLQTLKNKIDLLKQTK
ncbi:Htl1p PWA37_001960 [Arxiozyma heterogenica]|uniref:Htl1p n=1 Tax=Arxiozyma heterogenica TaxID=278026 RepID=UPI002EE47B4A